jgi:hypothetical protein
LDEHGNKIIDNVCDREIVFFDVKPSNFVYRIVYKGDDIFKMIDFDLRYSLEIEKKDKEIINNLLKVQMCIFGLKYNLFKSDEPDKKTFFFDLYKESFDYILMNILTKDGDVGGIVNDFLMEEQHFNFLYTIVHYSVGQFEQFEKNITMNNMKNIEKFMRSIIDIYETYPDTAMDEKSPMSQSPQSLFGHTAVDAPIEPVKYKPPKGKNTKNTAELKTNPEPDKPPVDEIPGYKLPKYCSGLRNGNWFGLDDIKWSFRPSSKDDVASYDKSLKLELDSLNQEMFSDQKSDQKMIVMGTETRK